VSRAEWPQAGLVVSMRRGSRLRIRLGIWWLRRQVSLEPEDAGPDKVPPNAALPPDVPARPPSCRT